jgi:hypothetical protein
MLRDSLIKLHFDDLADTVAIERAWIRYLGGTMAGLQFAARRRDVALAQHLLGLSLHATQDFYAYSSWVNDPARRSVPYLRRRTEPGWDHPLPDILYTGSYERPETQSKKPHGKYVPSAKVLRDTPGVKDPSRFSILFTAVGDYPVKVTADDAWYLYMKVDTGDDGTNGDVYVACDGSEQEFLLDHMPNSNFVYDFNDFQKNSSVAYAVGPLPRLPESITFEHRVKDLGDALKAFGEDDPLVGVSGEWGTWFAGSYITKIRFHTRNGTVSDTYGTGRYVANAKTFDLQAPDPATRQVVGFFGSEASADNGQAQCLGSIAIR